MKAVLLKEPGVIGVTELEQRPVQPGEALLKIHAAGICGSDIGAYRGTNGLVSYPRIIGHELAGEILSIPEDNPKGLKVGDHVVVEPYMYCGHCYPCSIGRTNCCDNMHVLGVHVDGGMAETFAHPAKWLVKVPDDMPWDIIPIAEPLWHRAARRAPSEAEGRRVYRHQRRRPHRHAGRDGCAGI